MVKPILCILAGGIILTGCVSREQSTSATLPPISVPATDTHNPGQVVWHDLATADLEQSKRFYGGLFGWTFEKLREEGRQYTAVYNGETLIAGMFQFTSKDREDPTGEWLVNISSSDVAGDSAKIVAAGGEILEPVRDVPNRGTVAFVRDPQQAIFLLANSSSGDPKDDFVPVGGWLWNELWTHDGQAALATYQNLFGYAGEPVDAADGRNYFLLSKNEAAVGGILEMRNKDIRPHWVPFLRVDDLQVSLVLAMELGATVLLEPDANIRDGKVALIQGPTGEPIVLQEFQFENR